MELREFGRIVFRHHGRTVDVFQDVDRVWHVGIQGDATSRGPFDTPGQAVEAGIQAAEAKKNARDRRRRGLPSRHRRSGKPEPKEDESS